MFVLELQIFHGPKVSDGKAILGQAPKAIFNVFGASLLEPPKPKQEPEA